MKHALKRSRKGCLKNCAEITVAMCDRSHIQYDFRAGAKAIRYIVNIA